jgi:DNA-binding transcriptional LysR family regulator
MDLNDLRIFNTVAESGSMSATARECELTQSAVSQIVRQLEKRLGAELIDRSSRPLRLTAAGRVVQRYAGRMREEAERMVAAIHASGVVPELRLSLVDSFAGTLGADVLQVAAQYAQNVYIDSGYATSHAQAFRSRRTDLIISPDPLKELDNVMRRTLLREPFVLIAPPGFALEKHDDAVLKALAESSLPLVRFGILSDACPKTDDYLRRQGLRQLRRLEVETADVMCALVSRGFGWGITTPLHLILAHVSPGDMVIRHLPDSFSRELFLIAREGEFSMLSEKLHEVVQKVLEQRIVPTLKRIAPDLERGFVAYSAVERG